MSFGPVEQVVHLSMSNVQEIAYFLNLLDANELSQVNQLFPMENEY